MKTKSPTKPIPPHDFPMKGMTSLLELSTHSGRRGMFPLSPDSWVRGVDRGDYPDPTYIGRTRYWHAVHVRAVVSGIDWRLVSLELPELRPDEVA
ncbi:MAG: hypothetical protein ABJI96_08210 [Paracoccaceae bacterium]